MLTYTIAEVLPKAEYELTEIRRQLPPVLDQLEIRGRPQENKAYKK